MKLADLEDKPNIIRQRIEMMDRRWNELFIHEKESIERLLQFLFLTNAGGAVAVLSFIGASKGSAINDIVIMSLASFSFGLIFVGLVHYLRLRFFSELFSSWRSNTMLFVQNRLDWEDRNTSAA